ncbi:MAG: NADH-quinone oxidoreductase subunit M [Chloroflexi bacterium]|nr:NADH-quinone oxidoreductase subunit M [Chloroflexota bacterium]
MFNYLSLLIALPLIGAIVLLFVPRANDRVVRWVAFITTLVTFAISVALFASFRATADMQFVERVAWIPQLGISYYIGVDGLSILLVVLTTFLMIIAIGGSWNGITERVREYHVLFLLLESAIIGVFVSLDLFLFYVFWEFTLIPMAFLIGIWGHGRRIYAAIKFILFTMLGSTLMLVAILVLVFAQRDASGALSFALTDILKTPVPIALQGILFAAFALAFAIKVPMFPFHTWLPDAHTEAPTAGSVILAAILLKMGTYGYVRFAMPLFPQATEQFTPLIATLSVIGIIYAALVAMVQEDVKKLVAYSSVAHLGFVMLGVFALNQQGVAGGMLQMLNHGISTGALFLIVGFIYERRHTRLITDFGGLSKQMPIFATVFMIVTLSSIGLPGTNGFVGEFLVLVGAYESHLRWYTVIATSGVILSAVYMLWMFQRVMFGELSNPKNQVLKDLNAREIVIMVPLIVMIFVMGLYPKPFIDRMVPAIDKMILISKTKQQVASVPAMPAMPAMPHAEPMTVTPAAEEK